MRTLVKLILSLSLIIFGLSESTAQGNKKVIGNGAITTTIIATQSYDKIEVIGSMDVHLEHGSEGNISVTTDSNIQEYIIVEIKDNALMLRTKNDVNLKTKNGIHINVPFKSISGVSLVGSGDIEAKDTIKSDFFDVSVIGSGDIIIAIESHTLDAKVIGTGDLTLSGTAINLEVKVSGSGDFRGNALSAEHTQVYVSGSGDAKVTASMSIKARINGSGTIEYSGNPISNDTKVVGSGVISSK
ncbi:MAG: head GIN domain-containing protein [Flavobacteriales bacterium]